jgi:hypothetical protein
MGKVLVERNEAHQEILLQLDDIQQQLQEMDRKIDGIARKEAETGRNQHGAHSTTSVTSSGVL